MCIRDRDGPLQSDNNLAANNTGVSKMKVTAGEQFQFIKLNTDLTAINRIDFLGSNLFYMLLFGPFIIIPVIVLLKKKKEASDGDLMGNKIKLSNRLAKKYLSEAKKKLNNKEPFYIALEKAMHNFLKAKLNIETSEMSKDKICLLYTSRCV